MITMNKPHFRLCNKCASDNELTISYKSEKEFVKTLCKPCQYNWKLIDDLFAKLSEAEIVIQNGRGYSVDLAKLKDRERLHTVGMKLPFKPYNGLILMTDGICKLPKTITIKQVSFDLKMDRFYAFY